MHFSTQTIHADESLASTNDIAAPMHVSTTYEYPKDYNYKILKAKGLLETQNLEEHLSLLNLSSSESDPRFVYSRESTETRDRVEAVLGAIEGGHAVTYSSGLAAINAALTFYQPQRIILPRAGYHGTHGVVGLYVRSRPQVKVLVLEEEPFPFKEGRFVKGDLVWLEMPQNPCGEIQDVIAFKERCDEGAVLIVDATFSPPPLMTCLSLGADCVMHSSTKFLGGHSDLLGGVLAVKDRETADKLRHDRLYLGSVMGNMEAWLLLRSLRTLEVRVTRQSETAKLLCDFLSTLHTTNPTAGSVVAKVHHASFSSPDLMEKLSAKPSPVLAIEFVSAELACLVCNRLKVFKNATSLGGVESLIDWRRAFDDKIAAGVCRVSIGLEHIEDLKADLLQAFTAAVTAMAKK